MLFQCYHFVLTQKRVIFYWTVLPASTVLMKYPEWSHLGLFFSGCFAMHRSLKNIKALCNKSTLRYACKQAEMTLVGIQSPKLVVVWKKKLHWDIYFKLQVWCVHGWVIALVPEFFRTFFMKLSYADFFFVTIRKLWKLLDQLFLGCAS